MYVCRNIFVVCKVKIGNVAENCTSCTKKQTLQISHSESKV